MKNKNKQVIIIISLVSLSLLALLAYFYLPQSKYIPKLVKPYLFSCIKENEFAPVILDMPACCVGLIRKQIYMTTDNSELSGTIIGAHVCGRESRTYFKDSSNKISFKENN